MEHPERPRLVSLISNVEDDAQAFGAVRVYQRRSNRLVVFKITTARGRQSPSRIGRWASQCVSCYLLSPAERHCDRLTEERRSWSLRDAAEQAKSEGKR